jgi:drug/metabolite transporter (DMT)-like permease
MRLTKIDRLEASRPLSLLLLVMTAILWSFGGLLIKLIQWNPIAISGMRSLIAAVIILIVLRRPRLPRSLPQIAGIAAYAATVLLFVVSNKLTTAANAILLQYTAPVYVALLGAWFLKERVGRADWLTIFLVLGGMLLFFLDDLKAGGLAGNITALLSGISFAVMIVCLRSQKSASPLETVFWGNVLTAVIGMPFMTGPLPDAQSWAGLLLLGVFQLGLSYILYAVAIKKVTALEGVLIPVIEPIMNPILVLFILGEIPGIWSIVDAASCCFR